jgi:acyl-CoA synthetase (AMP-forming)/AMP-acid ligase II
LHTWNSYAFTPRTQCRIYDFGTNDIELVVSPITHTTGLAGGLLKPLVGGGAVCLMDVWEPQRAVDLIDQIGCTQVTGATPFLALLLETVRARPGSGKALRDFICGGAPVPATLVREAADAIGCRVFAAYGQSEVLLLTSTTVDDDELAASRSDGRPLDGVDIKVVGPEEESLPIGTEGEICYRSPGAMLTYWDNPDAFDKIALPGSWRRTGDLGRLDADGCLRVTGRVKELIIRGGTNISMRELEELLLEHPTVARVAIVGVPDEVLGERVGAVVVPAPGRMPTLADLITYLRDDCKVSKQKLPERFLVVDELPVNATGKVLKFELVKRIAEEGVGVND